MADDRAPVSGAAKKAVADLFKTPPEMADDDESDAVSDDTDDLTYEIDDAVADEPLESADVAALVDAGLELLAAENFVFPDAESLLGRSIVGLLAGNLVLHGPPGTGKTRLADVLCGVFSCGHKIVTGTPDWSTYDVVGGLRPSIGKGGREVLRPWLGHVPAAALRCAATVEAHLAEESDEQAFWLVIDELSRADIDKAIGPLYTALSGTRSAQRRVDLWFEDAPARSSVTLPERFRLLATMNDVDTAFVNQVSQGLQRRFRFVYVGVPEEDQVETEVEQVSRQAVNWYARIYGEIPDGQRNAFADAFVADPRVTPVRAHLAAFVQFVRWDGQGPRWPLGSAQLVDVMREVALRAHSDMEEGDLLGALDRAVADRVIPQASALTEQQLKQVEQWLGANGLHRSVVALRQVREPHLTVSAETT